MTNLGEQLRVLTDEDTVDRMEFVTQVREQHAEFWNRWRAFRCTENGDGNGKAFWHVINLVDRHLDRDGTMGLFAKFMDLRPGTLVVDIAAGSRPSMLKVLLRNCPELSGYVVLEPPVMEQEVNDHFRAAGYNGIMAYVPYDYWHRFPTGQIEAIARERGARHIVTMTYWGATYLPRLEIRNWVRSALRVSERTYINTLSQGRFDPDVLKRKFAPLLVRLLLTRRAEFQEAGRALAAIPSMVEFGKEFSPLMPLWTASEIQEMLADIAHFGRVRTDASMDQTTFVELLPLESEVKKPARRKRAN